MDIDASGKPLKAKMVYLCVLIIIVIILNKRHSWIFRRSRS